MRRIKKMFVGFIVMAMLILSVNVSNVEAATDTAGVRVSYYKEDTKIVERTTWINSAGEVLRAVYPDGSGYLVYKKNGEVVTEKKFNGADYSLYEKWLKETPVLDNKPEVDSLQSRGSEITGSQYKHVYIASTSKVYKKEDMRAWKTFADAYAIIAIDALDIPSIVLSGFVQVIVNETIKNTPEKLTVKTSAYEVWHTYDNSYYIHCYHMKCNSVNPTKSYVDYSQAIGG